MTALGYLMPMTHAPETGTDETGRNISGLIFLCYPIHFKAIKQQTTQLI